jgi:mannose-6-phosphate isomerase-like protein (cupin superfamily)
MKAEIIRKVWGYEEWLIKTELYWAKHLHLEKGARCSIHYHREKDETFYVKRGIVRMLFKKGNSMKKESELTEIVLAPKEQIRIKPNTLHCFESLTLTSLILEVSTPHREEDSYRLVESRKTTPV